jgi:hypothetical protein
MPKQNYDQTRMYIIYTDHLEDQVFISGNCRINLKDELQYHKKIYMLWMDGICEYDSLFELLIFDNVQIKLIENYTDCKNKIDMDKRQNYWMLHSLYECINNN